MTRSVAVLDRLIIWAERGSRYLVWAAGICLLLAVGMVFIDVVSRKLLNHAIGGFSTEISGYILAIITSWSLSYGLFCKAHIRIDVAYARLGQLARAILDLISLIIFLLFALTFSIFAYGVARGSLEQGSLSNTPLQTPLWIPEFLWFAGIAWFTYTLSLILIRISLALAVRDFETIQRLAGSATINEEINEPPRASRDAS